MTQIEVFNKLEPLILQHVKNYTTDFTEYDRDRIINDKVTEFIIITRYYGTRFIDLTYKSKTAKEAKEIYEFYTLLASYDSRQGEDYQKHVRYFHVKNGEIKRIKLDKAVKLTEQYFTSELIKLEEQERDQFINI